MTKSSLIATTVTLAVVCLPAASVATAAPLSDPIAHAAVAAPSHDAGGPRGAKLACKGLSHKHVKGQKGTPFSRCIVAANAQRAQARHSAGPR